MAKLNFDAKLCTFDGSPVMLPRSTGQVPATYGLAIVEALSATYQDESTLTPAEKLQRGAIAYKIFKAGDVELTVEELAIIKKVAAKCFNPQILFLLDKCVEDQLAADRKEGASNA